MALRTQSLNFKPDPGGAKTPDGKWRPKASIVHFRGDKVDHFNALPSDPNLTYPSQEKTREASISLAHSKIDLVEKANRE